MERLICIIEEDKCRQFRRELECELHELKEAALLCDAIAEKYMDSESVI